jgi:hypothetical protein
MTELKSSSKGFNLFTPLVGTALVIMAIVIAAGMVQNDVRIARTLTSSYEISSQSITAKLIKATAEVKMLENMERITYEEISDFPFQCLTNCGQEMDDRILSKDASKVPSVYSRLVGWDGIFYDMIDALTTVLLGGETNYDIIGNSQTIQNSLSDAIKNKVKNPFDIGHDSNGNYYIKINAASFKQYEGDFTLNFINSATQSKISISVVPHDFEFKSVEPLYALLTKEKDFFVGTSALKLKDDFRNIFGDYSSGLSKYVKSFEYSTNPLLPGDKKLQMEFYKGGSQDTFTATFQTTALGSLGLVKITCENSPSGLSCH